MHRLALATRCLKLPLIDSLRATARAGVTAVQFDVRDELKSSDLSETGLRQFKQRLAEFAVDVTSVTFPLRRAIYDRERLEERVAALRQAMEFGWKLGARVLTTRIGGLPAADSRDREILSQVLSDLAQAGNHLGVTLAFSTAQESPQELHDLLATITTGPMGVDLDPAGLITSGQDPAEAVRTLHDRLLHVQARDGRSDVHESIGETELGRGQVDWPELLAVLHEAEYRGPLTLLRTQGHDPAGDVLRGVGFLKQLAFS